eukprot:GHVS01042762.1.p1 GENE.GHVS01042762.1~~GHVS01042762.1.p1  ORF type:complete len:178 (-),score=14.62 GHVS01042762.1:3-536(-)
MDDVPPNNNSNTLEVRFIVRKDGTTYILEKTVPLETTLSQIKEQIFAADLVTHQVRFVFMGRYLDQDLSIRSVVGTSTSSPTTVHAILTARALSGSTPPVSSFEHRLLGGWHGLACQEACLLVSLSMIILVCWFFYLSMPNIRSGFSTFFLLLFSSLWLGLLYTAARDYYRSTRRTE